MATLKNLVDETTVIKNELKTCHTNLKNNLVSKGVTVSSNDKMLNLINKISSISTVTKIVASDNVLFNCISSTNNTDNSISVPGNGSQALSILNFQSIFTGSIRIDLTAWSKSYSSYVKIDFVKNGTKLKTFSVSNSPAIISYDFNNILKGDTLTIQVYHSFNSNNLSVGVSKLEIKGDVA